jgi:putative transposase
MIFITRENILPPARVPSNGSAPTELKDYFRKNARRRVAKDRTITLNGKLYEAPVALIGKQVLLLYHENQPQQVEVLYNQQSYGYLILLDLHINARVKRDKNSGTDLEIIDKPSPYQGGLLWAKERREQK